MKILQAVSAILLLAITGLLSYDIFIENSADARLQENLVLAFYSSPGTPERKSAFQALQFMKSAGPLAAAVKSGLENNDPEIQTAAIAYLADIGGNENLQLIRGKISSDNKKISAAAVRALRQFPSGHIRGILLELFKSNDKHKQLTVLKIIREKKMKKDMEELQALEIKDEAIKKKMEDIALELGIKKKTYGEYPEQY